MPHRRKPEKGSFGSHFDVLVVHFAATDSPPPPGKGSSQRRRELQEKVDIHALLFEQAWKVDGER